MQPSLLFRSLWFVVTILINGVRKAFALIAGAWCVSLLLCGCGTQTTQEEEAHIPEPEDRGGQRVIRVLLNSQKRLNPGVYSLEVYFATQTDQKVPAASARLRVVE